MVSFKCAYTDRRVSAGGVKVWKEQDTNQVNSLDHMYLMCVMTRASMPFMPLELPARSNPPQAIRQHFQRGVY